MVADQQMRRLMALITRSRSGGAPLGGLYVSPGGAKLANRLGPGIEDSGGDVLSPVDAIAFGVVAGLHSESAPRPAAKATQGHPLISFLPRTILTSRRRRAGLSSGCASSLPWSAVK